jgi:selenocysteine lyase/cysteine desulfurase
MALDLKKANVDFAASQATKWLAGPIGAGFLYASKDIWNDLKPQFVGWKSVKNYRDFGFFDRELIDDAAMFHAGSPPIAVYAGFRESLKVMLSVDETKREKIAMDNAAYLKKRLSEEHIGFYDFGKEHDSPIISCTPKNIETLEDDLRKQKIFCSVRYGRLRVSPHFYNNHEEIDTLMEYLV